MLRYFFAFFLGLIALLSACSTFSGREQTVSFEVSPVTPNENVDVLATTQPDMPPEVVSPAIFYQVETGKPAYIENTYYPPSKCAWSGVGGQVVHQSGMHVSGLYAQVQALIDGRLFQRISIIGAAQEFGPGGYRITLSNQPFETKDKFSIQLIDTNGLPRSPRVPFDTYNNCDMNLVNINFMIAPEAVKMHMPVIMNQPEAGP